MEENKNQSHAGTVIAAAIVIYYASKTYRQVRMIRAIRKVENNAKEMMTDYKRITEKYETDIEFGRIIENNFDE